MRISVLFILFLISFAGLTQSSKPDNKHCILYLQKRDVPLEKPQPGDWLYHHAEKGQTFEQYVQSKPVKASALRNTIYILPIGNFTKAEWRVVQFTADYLQLFFDRTVKVLPKTEATMVLPAQRRNPNTDEEQWLTTPILDYLEKKIPTDGVVMMAMTASDLYPSPNYNFVFGIARTQQRVGISSLHRYSDSELDSTHYQKCMERLIKTSSHEITHMLSVKHCIAAVCLMNGSNSLSESDRRPNRLCSSCLHKLQWNLQFNIPERLEKLAAYFKRHKLQIDLSFAEADIQAIGE